MFKNKKILFIHFWNNRGIHNKKIFEFLSEEKIILYTSIFIKFRRSDLENMTNTCVSLKVIIFNQYLS